jgi:hypothetical protein
MGLLTTYSDYCESWRDRKHFVNDHLDGGDAIRMTLRRQQAEGLLTVKTTVHTQAAVLRDYSFNTRLSASCLWAHRNSELTTT